MQSRSRVSIGLLLVLVLASISLRLLLLFERPLWFDELFTVWAARLPFKDLIAALRSDSGPPFFYLLERPFALVADRFPESDWILRLPSLFAGLLLFAAARALPKGTARIFFVVLLSCSPLLNLYSGEARAYALLALLCLSLFLLVLRGDPEPPGRRLWAVTTVGAVALYTHYLAVFAVAALLLLGARARRWRACAALLAAAAVFAPWASVLLAQPTDAVAWMREPFGKSILGFLSALGGVGRVPGPFGAPPAPAMFFAGAAAGALCLGLLLVQARSQRRVPEAPLFVLLVLAGALAAGAWRPIAFAGRTEVAVLPVWIWGLAAAVTGRRALRMACGAVSLLGLVVTAGMAFQSRLPSPPTAIAETVGRVAGAGDLVLASGAFYLPARLAADRGRMAGSVKSMPADLEEHPGWFVPALPGRVEESLLASSMASVPPGHRLFLIVPAPYQTEGLARILAAGDGRARTLMRSRDAFVALWTRNPPRRATTAAR